MAAVAFTAVTATENEIVFSWSGDAAGSLTLATMVAAAKSNSALKAILSGLTANCNGADAVAALITGATFTGVNGESVTTNIHARVESGAAVAAGLAAAEEGATNSPQLTITPAAASSGWLYVTHIHSVVQ